LKPLFSVRRCPPIVAAAAAQTTLPYIHSYLKKKAKKKRKETRESKMPGRKAKKEARPALNENKFVQKPNRSWAKPKARSGESKSYEIATNGIPSRICINEATVAVKIIIVLMEVKVQSLRKY